ASCGDCPRSRSEGTRGRCPRGQHAHAQGLQAKWPRHDREFPWLSDSRGPELRAGRVGLLVDDIVDTGRTLLYARDLLRERGVASVFTCTPVEKPSRREVAIGDELWRNIRLQPKTAFSRFPPVHRADLEGQQRAASGRFLIEGSDPSDPIHYWGPRGEPKCCLVDADQCTNEIRD